MLQAGARLAKRLYAALGAAGLDQLDQLDQPSIEPLILENEGLHAMA